MNATAPGITAPAHAPALAALRRWPARRFALALVAAAVIALAIGLPTDVVANPIFSRTVGVRWWDYAVLAATSAVGGLLVAAFTAPAACPVRNSETRGGFAASLLGVFAVGCPVCNHVVVLVLGSAGALSWFAPVQPLLGVASVALMAWVLRARLRVSAS